MRLTLFSIRNPLLVGVATLAVVCFGLYSYLTMGVGIFPNISFPGVTIVTTVPGADPGTVETQVTKPIEDAMNTLPNIDQITSTSGEGISLVQVQFTSAANSTLIPVDAERVVNAARSKLPAEAEAPTIVQFETSAFPVITVGLSGTQSLDRLQQIAEDVVQKRFEVLPGVGTVQLGGGPTREIQVKVDLARLQGRGLGLNSVQQALQSEHVEFPAGTLTADKSDVNVRLAGLVRDPAELGDIIISQTPSGPIFLKDVATVEDTSKKVETINRVNGVPAVTLTVAKLASANTLEVSREIRQAMAEMEPTLPPRTQMYVVNDAAIYTQQSFNTIRKTLAEAVLFTGLILLMFLHTWRGTFIVLVAIPTSLFTTFGVMNLLGLNLNLISMLALTLSVGILVDDSIVVLENIYRHLGLGERPVVAALNGRNEIGLAAITITMVDVVVYLPIALISDLSGEFIRPFALVITSATLTSLLVSFTLTPLLGSRFLRFEHALSQGRDPLSMFGRRWDAAFGRVSRTYQRLLRKTLNGRAGFLGLRWMVIAAGLLSFVLGLGLLSTGRIGFDIFPSGDQGEIDVTLVMPPSTAIETTDAVVKTLETRLRENPDVDLVYSNTGGSGGSTAFLGASGGDQSRIFVHLKPRAERTRESIEIADEIRAHLADDIPNAQLRVGLPNPFGFGGFGQQAIQVAVRGPNPEVLNPLVDQITSMVKQTPGAVDVNNDNEKVQREYLISVDRPRAADLGVTAQQAATALRTAVSGTVVSKFRRPGQSDVDIRLIADDSFRGRPENLATLPLLTNLGNMVRLGQLGDISTTTAPTQIRHVDRERSVVVNASAGNRLVGDIQRDIETQVAGIQLPQGYSVTYAGQAQQGGQSFGFIFRAMAAGLVLMYLLMVMLFRSLTLPLSVLMSLPLAVVGSLGAMAITGTPFTLFALLGFTLLMGLVGKNAILLVDYTDTLRRQGKTRSEALLEAGPTRLRPIVMTTMSVVVALAPLAFGIEEGSELLKSAAVVLIGGLITSTLLTLVFIPAMYTIFDDLELAVKRFFRIFSKPRAFEQTELAILHPNMAVGGNANDGHETAAIATGGSIPPS